jgi:hypothetical protein
MRGRPGQINRRYSIIIPKFDYFSWRRASHFLDLLKQTGEEPGGRALEMSGEAADIGGALA